MNYTSILKQYENILIGRWLTDLSNTSAFLMSEIPRLNWVGFYLREQNKLWLGPFQGKPACTEIDLGRGVCGKAAQQKNSIVVEDVHKFQDHIACDSASNSEVVVPLIVDDQVIGVLDVDSPELARFGEDEKKFFEQVVQILLQKSKPY